ncbi:MAG: HIT domain-containing protein [Rickettsiales bacterium]|nr:HIT domain-containing protein [Rickettsiales bacterium]
MAYDSNNVFAKIIRGEIAANKVYEDEKVLAFHDISKTAPTHVLVIPKGDYLDFSDFAAKAKSEEISHFFQKVSEVANLVEAQKSGFRLISNMGLDANQSVAHFHVHILAGKNLGPLIA